LKAAVENTLFSIKSAPIVGFKRFAMRCGDGIAEGKLIKLASFSTSGAG
jgi:hypothetical protein